VKSTVLFLKLFIIFSWIKWLKEIYLAALEVCPYSLSAGSDFEDDGTKFMYILHYLTHFKSSAFYSCTGI
jgi:predicted RNase H-related nuclease YkuK (DUF458 family)